jgi:hypothetical protein
MRDDRCIIAWSLSLSHILRAHGPCRFNWKVRMLVCISRDIVRLLDRKLLGVW